MLGLDFLQKYNCLVDLRRNSVNIDGEEMYATLKRNGEHNMICISSVVVQQKLRIPPNSVFFVDVVVTKPIPGQFVIEPSEDSRLAVSAVFGENKNVSMKVINLSMSY